MSWKVRSIRGATTCAENTEADIREAVTELLHDIETLNSLDLSEVVHVTFSVTKDLDKIFPAAIARRRDGWDLVPLLDVQHMHVEGGLTQCIRCLIQFNTEQPDQPIHHVYLREAQALRPDLCIPAQAVI